MTQSGGDALFAVTNSATILKNEDKTNQQSNTERILMRTFGTFLPTAAILDRCNNL